ncbi:DUF2835 domain-containing protein [Marinobacteraceae bacterium S3BR75-40.1]
MAADRIIVDLSISRDQWLRMYRGEARYVHARARDGRSVQFPARILAPFVLHDGVRGSFLIEYDEGKFQNIERL